MQTLLRISGRYAGISPHSKDQFVDAVSLLKDRAQKDEANALFGVVNDMSKVGEMGGKGERNVGLPFFRF